MCSSVHGCCFKWSSRILTASPTHNIFKPYFSHLKSKTSSTFVIGKIIIMNEKLPMGQKHNRVSVAAIYYCRCCWLPWACRVGRVDIILCAFCKRWNWGLKRKNDSHRSHVLVLSAKGMKWPIHEEQFFVLNVLPMECNNSFSTFSTVSCTLKALNKSAIIFIIVIIIIYA